MDKITSIREYPKKNKMKTTSKMNRANIKPISIQ